MVMTTRNTYKLPTPFYRGIEGVGVALCNAHAASPKNSLDIMLPGWMVPRRRYCQVRVSTTQTGAFLIEVLHQEPYTHGIPGRNAWQATYSRETYRVPGESVGFANATLLTRRLSTLVGEQDVIDQLRKRLCGSPATHDMVTVRVTPEGFQLMVYRSRDAARGVGQPLGTMERDLLERGLLPRVLLHGNRDNRPEDREAYGKGRMSNRERFEQARQKAEAAKPRQEELDLGEVTASIDGKPVVLKNVRMTFESPLGRRPEAKKVPEFLVKVGFTSDGREIKAHIIPPSQAPRWNTCRQSFIDEDGARDIYAEYAKSLEFGTEHMAAARRFIDSIYPEPEAVEAAAVRRTAAFIRCLVKYEDHEVTWTRDWNGEHLSCKSVTPPWMGNGFEKLSELFALNGLYLQEVYWNGDNWVAQWTVRQNASLVFNALQEKEVVPTGKPLYSHIEWQASLDDRTRASHLAEHHLRKQYRYASGYGYRGTFADLARQMRSFHNRGGHAVDVHVTDAFNYRGLLVTEVPFIEINPQTEDKETDMQKIDNTTNETNPLLVAGQRIVKATFEGHNGAKDYAYYTDIELAVGDFAVVVSPYGELYDEESKGYITTVKITSIDEDVTSVQKASKWIVQKVDLAGYRERIGRIEELKTLDAKITRATAEARKLLELEKLAELSPDLKALVARRLELTVGKVEEEAPAPAAEPARS